MKVHELMSDTVECVLSDGSLTEAARKMAEHDIGALPVIDEGRAVGIVTDRDLVRHAVSRGRHPDQTKVAEVMTRDLVWCDRDDDLDRAAALMREATVRRLLVRDDQGRIGGIVTLGDLARGPDAAVAGRTLGAICQQGRAAEATSAGEDHGAS